MRSWYRCAFFASALLAVDVSNVSAQANSPGCYVEIAPQPGWGIPDNSSRSIKAMVGPYDTGGQWTQAKLNALTSAVDKWQQADNAAGLNISLTSGSSTSLTDQDVQVRIWNSPNLPNCDAPQCDATFVPAGSQSPTIKNGTIYLNPNLSADGVHRLILHELGHYHGLADMYGNHLIGRTVMVDDVYAGARIDYVTACDQVKVREYTLAIGAGYPGGGGGCQPGGCYNPGLPCEFGGGPAPGGWCYPPGGGGGVTTDWWWYFFSKPNTAPVAAILTNGTIPSTGSVSIGTHDYDGKTMKVNYYVNDQYVGSSVTNPFSLSYSNAAPGTYKVQAHVMDQRMGWGWTAPVWLTVQAAPTYTTLAPWQRIYSGQRVYSPNLQYYLEHQWGDGHLVAYVNGGPAYWATGVAVGGGNGFTEMDGVTGNFVS